MSSTHPVAMGLTIFVAPLLCVLFYQIWRINRSMKEAERYAAPFEPRAESSGALLRRFTPPQRVYLRQQLKLSAGVYLFLGWIFLFMLSLPFLGQPATASLWFNPSALFWFRFLGGEVSAVHVMGSMLFFDAFLTISPLRLGGEARYYRTRPLSIGFLFWARLLPLLFALIVAIATSIAVVYGLVFALKGPIWQHLPSAIPRSLGPEDADIARDYLNLLVTSVPRVLLSTLTTILMLFSAMLVMVTIPRKNPGTSGVRFLVPIFIVGAAGPSFWNLFNTFQHVHLPRELFIYDYLGPPPPYGFALVPIALSVIFMALARYLVTRLEV